MTIDCDKTLVSTIQASCTESDNDTFLASSKVLLSAPFSELRSESGTVIHSVQLCLTSDGEIIVLKRPSDKSQKFSFLRRHKIYQTDFSMHSLLANAMMVRVPYTVLAYIYQANGEPPKPTIADWLYKVEFCKRSKPKPDSSSTTSKRKQFNPSPLRSGTNSVGQSTSYQPTDESLLSYSSPTHPVLPPSIRLNSEELQSPKGTSSTSTPKKQGGAHSLGGFKRPKTLLVAQSEQVDSEDHFDTSMEIVQMPNGLIKARSFQGRGSAKHRFTRNNSSMSGLDGIGQDRSQELTAHSSTHHTSTPPPHSSARTPSPTVGDNPFESRLRHTQIRNRKWKCSPRINRSNSAQVEHSNPLLREVIDKYSRSASSTPTPGSTSSLATISSTAETSDLTVSQSSNSSTLPRTKKGKKFGSREERYTSVSESATGPTAKTPAKSPRILRMFHRRWQSSSAIKVPPSVVGEDSRGSPAPSESSEAGSSQPLTPVKKLHQFSPKEVAEQLSLMDAELLRKIAPEELENGAWMKKDRKEQLAPNVMAMVRSFNQLALLITSEILEEKTPQARAKVISTYIQIASKCYANHNYNSLKAVLAGLQSTPIYRLKKTWKEVPSKKRKRFEQLGALMSECENWQLYREEINTKMASGTPFIPFLGMFLTQVVQLESYAQARQNRQASTSPTDSTANTSSNTSSKALSVPDDIKRRRSSSLGDCAVHSTTSSSLSKPNTTQDMHLNIEPTSTISVSAPVSPAHSPSLSKGPRSRCSCDSDSEKDRNHLKSLSIDSSCLSPPPSLGNSDEDEVDCGVHDDAGSHTTDSGHHSSSSHMDNRSPPLPKSRSHGNLCTRNTDLTSSQVDLNQIYVSLQRQSQSYETLLNVYTDENHGLRNVLRSTLAELSRLSGSLQSLDSSVFSDEESDLAASSSYTQVDLDSDLDPTTSDYGSGANILPTGSLPITSHADPCPPAVTSARRVLFSTPSMEVRNCQLSPENEQCELPCEQNGGENKGIHAPQSTSNSRVALFRAKSEEVKNVCKLSVENDRCEFAQEEQESSETSSSGGTSNEKKKRRVRRSKSLSGGGVTKVVLRQKRNKLKSRKSVHGSDEVKPIESSNPAEILNCYQVASLGCSMGVDMNKILRSVICDSEPNTENVSYKLSLEREGHRL